MFALYKINIFSEKYSFHVPFMTNKQLQMIRLKGILDKKSLNLSTMYEYTQQIAVVRFNDILYVFPRST